MKNVLVVDANPSVLHGMQTAIQTHASGLDVVIAHNGMEAIEALSIYDVDVICVDAQMEAVEGYPLFTHMLLHHPAVPVIVMTDHDPAELAERIDGLGFIDYLHKPFDEQQAVDIVHMQVDARAQGYMAGMTLFGLLELLRLHNTTCVVDMQSHGREGLFAFINGELVDALCDKVIGAEAVHQLFVWQLTNMVVHNNEYHPVRTIATPLPQLLEEVIQRNRAGGDAAFVPEPALVGGALDGAGGAVTSSMVVKAPLVATATGGPAVGELVEDVEQLVGNDVQVLCARARTDIARGNWARAQTSITTALEQDSLCTDAYFLLAQWHEHQAEYEQAITAYRRAVFIDANFVPGILGMATAFKALGRRPDAQRCYRNALKQLAVMPPDVVIIEMDGATAAEVAIFVSHQLQ